MNQDIMNQNIPQKNHFKIEDLYKYANKKCKICYGKGYLKKIKNIGNKQWEFEKYDICNCILKSKKIELLLKEMNK